MRISRENLRAYEEDGYLFLPGYLTSREVDVLVAELPKVFAEDGPRRVLEKNGKSVRSVYGAHTLSPTFERLVRHPKLVIPCEQILGSSVYVYQFKINAKLGLVGDVWEWHQDFIFWHKEDGLPESRALNAVIFLHDVNEFNGPMFLIPGSHRYGMIDVPGQATVPAAYAESPDWISNLTADLKYSIDPSTLKILVSEHGIVAPKGERGSLLFFHPNVAHASSPNLSPFDRTVAIVSYNSVENLPRPQKERRPDFLVADDYRPVMPLTEDALFTVTEDVLVT
jgi:ectoine hydroxylase-related dioxygenase (phytanoyl-CoA dioxygenase family)